MFLADKEMKKMLETQYVFVKLDVLENEDKKHLENPGGVDVLAKLKGERSGLPFFAVTDATGKMLINSNSKEDGKEGNVGYPAAPHEIGWFLTMLEKTSKLNATQRNSVKTWFEKNAPKR